MVGNKAQIENEELKSIDLNALKSQKQYTNDIKYVSAVTGGGSLPSYRLQQIQSEYNPSQEAIEFAQNWDRLPQWQKDKWFSENKKELELKTATRKQNWAYATPNVKQAAISNVGQVVGAQNLNWGKAFVNNPDVALAAAKALNNGRIDMKQMKTLEDAVELVDLTVKLSQVASDTKRQELFDRLSTPQKMAIVAVSDAMFQEWQNSISDVKDESAGFLSNLWGATGSKLFDGLIWLNDQAQHVYRTGFYSLREQVDPLTAWRDTETGSMDVEAYNGLVAKYGKLNVDVVRDAVQAFNDPDGFATLVEKYAGNDAALQIIDQIVLQDERTPEIDNLFNEVGNVTRDDLGNMVADALTPESWQGNQVWQLLDKGTNFAAVWFGDPTLIGGKAIRSYRIMKYGIMRNVGTGNMTRLMDRPEVKRLFDGFSDDVLRYTNEPDVVNANILRNDIRIKYGKFFTDDVIDDFSSFLNSTQRGPKLPRVPSSPAAPAVPKAKPAKASYNYVQSIIDDYIRAVPEGASMVKAGFSGYPASDKLKEIFVQRKNTVLDDLRTSGMPETELTSLIDDLARYSDDGTIGKVLQLEQSPLVQKYNIAYAQRYLGLGPDDTVRLYRSIGSESALKTGTEQVGYTTFSPRMALNFSLTDPNRRIVAIDVKIKNLHQPFDSSGFGDEFSMGVSLKTPIEKKKVYSAEQTKQLVERLDSTRHMYGIFETTPSGAFKKTYISQRMSPEFRFDFPKVTVPRPSISLPAEQFDEFAKAVETLESLSLAGKPKFKYRVDETAGTATYQITPAFYRGAISEQALEAVATIERLLKVKLMKPKEGAAFLDIEKRILGVDDLDQAAYATPQAAWRGWITEHEGIEKLLLGKAVRSDRVLMPHASAAKMRRSQKYLELRKKLSFTGPDLEFIRDLFGPEVTATMDDILADPELVAKMRQAQVDNFVDAMLQPEIRSTIASRYGVDLETVVLRADGNLKGLPKKAKYQVGGFSVSRDAWAVRTDRWIRNLETAPNGRKIKIVDGSDVDQVYAWARTTFSAPMARQIAEIWKTASVGQRRNILASMFNTIAEARGITNLTPEMSTVLDDIVTSSLKTGEQYAVTQARIASQLTEVDILAEGSARALREVMPDLSTAAQKKVAALGYRISQVIQRRRELAKEVKAIAFDAGATAKRAKTEQGILDDLQALRDDTSDATQALRTELQATADELERLMDQVSGEVAGDLAAAKANVTGTVAGSSKALSAINRKIKNLEAKLKKSADEDQALIQSQLDDLKKARDNFRKDSTQAYFESKRLTQARNLLQEPNDWVNYNPAEVNGRQHALHLYQTADAVSVPDFGKLQIASAKVGLLNRMIGWTWGDEWTSLTNGWSFLNLAGPRYVQRAGIEDHLGFVLSGGSLADLGVSRRMSRAVREARGRTVGVIGEKALQAGDIIADNNRILGNFVREHMDQGEIALAKDLAEAGMTENLQRLTIKALSRYKLTNLVARFAGKKREDIEDALAAFADLGDEGFALLDEVAEIGRDLNSFSARGADVRPTGLRMRSDMQEMRRVQYGDWTQIGFNDYSANAHILWYKQLRHVLHTDGRIGQILFKHLRKSDTIAQAKEKAIPEMVELLAEGGFPKGRFSIFDEGISDLEFASRYFDDAAWYFSAANGEAVNKKLVQMLTRKNPDSGAIFGGVYARDKDGVTKDELFIDQLRTGFDASNRPQFVLGRHEAVTAMEETKVGFMDKSWSIMSDSLGRVSREPIFFARYTDEYIALKPLIQKYVDEGIELDAARKMVRDLAVRRAEEISLSYMDNPAVRSIGAFNVRNIARYYRATEDFYRRVLRLAKYNPEAIQKLSLGYSILDQSGFIWNDDQGEQYFIYPGSGMLHDAMATFASVAGLGGLSTSSPFVFGGKTLMLTPSADPNSWLPTLASPIAGVGAKLLTAFGPFQELEQFLLGQRGTQPTTGLSQLGDELLRAALPAHVTRAMATMTKDDRNSMYASSVKSAIQIMAYNGELDVDKIRTEGDKTRILETASNTAIAVLGLRFILGISLPASPETMQNPGLTVEARQLGLKSLRRGYTELLTKFNGDSDKATLAWFKINPRLLPFTVSTTEAKKQTYPSLTVDAGKWIKQNMQFVKEYPEAMPFLAPRAGEFSFGTYSLAKSLGYIEGKSVDQSLLEIITSRDYYVYRNTKDSYEAALAGATSSQEKAAYDQQWDNLTRQMYAENPFLETRVNQFSDKSNIGLKKRVLVDMRSALQDIYKNRPNLVNESTDRIYSMVQTFDSAMADIAPYVGKTDTYSETVRRNYRDRLRGILVEIAGDDVNAKTFYDTTLDRLIGG